MRRKTDEVVVPSPLRPHHTGYSGLADITISILSQINLYPTISTEQYVHEARDQDDAWRA